MTRENKFYRSQICYDLARNVHIYLQDQLKTGDGQQSVYLFAIISHGSAIAVGGCGPVTVVSDRVKVKASSALLGIRVTLTQCVDMSKQ